MIRADRITVGEDEGHYTLDIETDEGDRLRVDIHGVVLKFYDDVRREIGPYAYEADMARRDIATGTFSVRAEMLGAIADQDTGYALDDPKHPTYHDRMVD